MNQPQRQAARCGEAANRKNGALTRHSTTTGSKPGAGARTTHQSSTTQLTDQPQEPNYPPPRGSLTCQVCQMRNSPIRFAMIAGVVSLIHVSVVCIYMMFKSLFVLGLRKSTNTINVGFFHPFAGDGGGGERVLWRALQECQLMFPSQYRYTVYTGGGVPLSDMLVEVKRRFNIDLDAQSIHVELLDATDWLDARHFPVLTMVGQAIASVLVGCQALCGHAPPPHYMFDTMGYAFAYPVFHHIGGCNILSYVHYPSISSDMLKQVVERRPTYNNSEGVSKSTTLSTLKQRYYQLYAWGYKVVGGYSSLVMVNSTWTRNHIVERWAMAPQDVHVVYPPVDTSVFERFPLDEPRSNQVISVGQFRPEKDHALQLRAWAQFLSMSKGKEEEGDSSKLVLIGGCRGPEDEQRVYSLRSLAAHLGISDHVEFALNLSYSQLLEELHNSKVGIHTMWNEHFGIGVVEMCSSGLVTVAHNSGGPLSDIITHGETGYLATTPMEYAKLISTVLRGWQSHASLRAAARVSMRRFSEDAFHHSFCKLLRLHIQ